MRYVLTLLLAGGKGTRLEPLTRDRAKPAVPFGGLYRIIDFPLSNCINSRGSLDRGVAWSMDDPPGMSHADAMRLGLRRE